MIRPQNGFTLVELLVVLLVISVVFVAMPVAYDRMMPGLELRSDAREIARIFKETRGWAIANNEESTVLIDLKQRFVRAGSTGERFDLAKGTSLTLETALSEQISSDFASIRFYPSGASTGGRVTLRRLGKINQIEVDWLFGRVRILE